MGVSRAEDQVLRVIRFMSENVDRNLDLETCARKAGWSRSHFSQGFRHQTNVSPMEFFARLKTARACEMLTNSDESVKEIADKLGFSDPFYFSPHSFVLVDNCSQRRRDKEGSFMMCRFALSLLKICGDSMATKSDFLRLDPIPSTKLSPALLQTSDFVIGNKK
jgi:AraC-like DNA-binding protein